MVKEIYPTTKIEMFINFGNNEGLKMPSPKDQIKRQEWINKLRNRKLSEESKRKISEFNKGKIVSMETRIKMSNAQKGKIFSEEHRKNLSLANLGKKHSIETKKKMSLAKIGEKNTFYGKHHTEETRKRISLFKKGKKGTPWSKENKTKMSIAQKGINNTFYGRKHSEKSKEKMGLSHKRFMIQNPEKFEKSIRDSRIYSQQIPNKTEKILIDFFQQSKLPYKYVGGGEVMIGNKNPDFINFNGQKKIIELFGYWHKDKNTQYHRTEKGTIEHYKKYGFNTLIIWAKKLKYHFPETIQKIVDFDGGK